MSESLLYDLKVEIVPIEVLKPYNNNARIHSPKQIQQIANSIKEFGFMNPALIDSCGGVMAGHGRIEAAKKLGLKSIPVIRTDHLTDAQRKAYIIADNKIAANAGWDKDILAIELQYLTLETNFEIEVTGFEMSEIDVLIDGAEILEPHEEIPELDHTVTITKPGDVWQLGSHLLICGDSTKPDTYNQLLGGQHAQMIFTDPPYNVPIQGHVCGNGKIKHDEFAMASGEMTEQEFRQFLKNFMIQTRAFSQDGSLHYICMDWRHIDMLLLEGKQCFAELKNICVWNKDNGGMGALYRSKHEFVVVFKHGTAPHINNIELGKYGRYRTNVWDYAGVNSFAGRQSDLKMHPTVKPVALVADAIKDCTKRGHIVLDPFAGSGTTLIAAEKTGRIARCIELAPKYCDVIIRRWQALTGKDAFNLDSFATFNEMAGGKYE
ncbi:MAG: DNA methyltransferase [Pseudomonadota bacterium]